MPSCDPALLVDMVADASQGRRSKCAYRCCRLAMEVVRRLRPPGAGSSETPHFVVVQQFGQELVRHSRHPQHTEAGQEGARTGGSVPSCPRPPERRRLEANRGLRSRAASELTDRSLPKRSRPAAFIGPSSSLPSWTGLHATTSDAGGRSSSLTAGASTQHSPGSSNLLG